VHVPGIADGFVEAFRQRRHPVSSGPYSARSRIP
jgi:hypothetical protein